MCRIEQVVVNLLESWSKEAASVRKVLSGPMASIPVRVTVACHNAHMTQVRRPRVDMALEEQERFISATPKMPPVCLRVGSSTVFYLRYAYYAKLRELFVRRLLGRRTAASVATDSASSAHQAEEVAVASEVVEVDAKVSMHQRDDDAWGSMLSRATGGAGASSHHLTSQPAFLRDLGGRSMVGRQTRFADEETQGHVTVGSMRQDKDSSIMPLHFRGKGETAHVELCSSMSAAARVASSQPFHAALASLLCRYQTLMGPFKQGTGLHAAIPRSVVEALHAAFGISVECFASPFNAVLPTYCSACYDTDVLFGSLGDFFSLGPRAGSYYANPPFLSDVIERMADRIGLWFNTVEAPLCFVIVVPDWKDDDKARGLHALQERPECRAVWKMERMKHFFVEGQPYLDVAFEKFMQERKQRRTGGGNKPCSYMVEVDGEIKVINDDDDSEDDRDSLEDASGRGAAKGSPSISMKKAINGTTYMRATCHTAVLVLMNDNAAKQYVTHHADGDAPRKALKKGGGALDGVLKGPLRAAKEALADAFSLA